MRLIDADAMIDRLKEWDTKDKTDKMLYNFTLNRINEQPTIQPVQRWIPCSEITADGYPIEDGTYYVTEQNYGFYLDADNKQIVAHISRFKSRDFVDRFYDSNHSNITAWMPLLPEPYKDDEQNE